MTKKERKEIAIRTVENYMKCYKGSSNFLGIQSISENERFIEGMITGFEYTDIITYEERIEWTRKIREIFKKWKNKQA